MNRIATDVQRTFEHAGEKTSPIKVEEIVLGKQAADSFLDYVKQKTISILSLSATRIHTALQELIWKIS